MVIILCECEEGLGLAHSHVPEMFTYRKKSTGVNITFPADVIDMNRQAFDGDDYEFVKMEPECIRIGVNWHSVAHDLMVEE